MIENHICPETLTAVGLCHCSVCEEKRLRKAFLSQARGAQNVAPGSPLYDKVMGTNTHAEWARAYDEARASHAAGEPLIRTICKIAARILFVILVVGVIVGVMV